LIEDWSNVEGCWLHGVARGCRLEEIGADSSRETRPQLHDGHSTHQEGNNLKFILQTDLSHLFYFNFLIESTNCIKLNK